MPIYNEGGPAAYAQGQQSRQDDQFRQLLQMMMMGMQQKTQQGQYSDEMRQQALENQRKEIELGLERRRTESGELGAQARMETARRPEKTTLGDMQLAAILNDPNTSAGQKRNLIIYKDTLSPSDRAMETSRLKKEGEETDRVSEESRLRKLGLSDMDVALMMRGQTPLVVTQGREDIQQDSTQRKVAAIDADPNLTDRQKEERKAILHGLGPAYYQTERDKSKEKITTVSETGRMFQGGMAALAVIGDKKGKQRFIDDYKKTGVFLDLPKRYTEASINASKGIASPAEMEMETTRAYLQDWVDRELDLEDIPKNVLRQLPHKATVMLFFSKYSQKSKGTNWKDHLLK